MRESRAAARRRRDSSTPRPPSAIEQFQQLQEKQRKMAQQAELTGSLLEKVPRSFLLAEITNAHADRRVAAGLRARVASAHGAAPPPPKTAFEVRQEDAPTTTPAAAAAGRRRRPSLRRRAQVTGVAATDVQVAQFIAQAEQSQLLKDVNLVISEEFKTGRGRQLRPQVPDRDDAQPAPRSTRSAAEHDQDARAADRRVTLETSK